MNKAKQEKQSCPKGVMLNNYKERGSEVMRKELEYAKKVALIVKLYRSELLSEKEYEKIRRKLMDSYMIAGERSDEPMKAIA